MGSNEDLKLFEVNITCDGDVDVYVMARDQRHAEQIAQDNISEIIEDLDSHYTYDASEVTTGSLILAEWADIEPYTSRRGRSGYTVGELFERLKQIEAERGPSLAELESMGQQNLLGVLV